MQVDSVLTTLSGLHLGGLSGCKHAQSILKPYFDPVKYTSGFLKLFFKVNISCPMQNLGEVCALAIEIKAVTFDLCTNCSQTDLFHRSHAVPSLDCY